MDQRVTPGLTDVVRLHQVSLSMPKNTRRGGAGRAKRLRRFAGETRRQEIPFFENLSLAVAPGQCVALVGGRSIVRQSILRLMAGTLMPDSGTVERSQHVTPMIETARSFGRSFTARQNAYLVGGLLGMSPEQVSERLDWIWELSGLEAVADKPMRGGSAALRQRLAWAVTMATQSSAFAIDQTLVVGQPEYREKCWTHIDRLREQGVTIVLSTDTPKVYERVIDRAVVFAEGQVVADTDISQAIDMVRQARMRNRENPDSEH